MKRAKQTLAQTIGTVFALLAVLAVVACLVTVQIAGAEGEGMSEQRRASIVQNCDSIKLRLKQTQTSDALMRVTLGKDYESMLTNLMDAMNSRLVSNRLDSGQLPTIAADFSRNLGYFRKNYISYDQKIDELQKLDCTKNPDGFYKQLETARNLRSALRMNYDRLNELVDSYHGELEAVWKGRNG